MVTPRVPLAAQKAAPHLQRHVRNPRESDIKRRGRDAGGRQETGIEGGAKEVARVRRSETVIANSMWP